MNSESANPGTILAYKDFKQSVLQSIERIQADEEANRRSEALLPSKSGGVYFAWSDCLNCMKIGATRRDPQLRLREISLYVTTPFTLTAWTSTKTPFRLEKEAHRYFNEERINTRGSGAGTEFFCISAADVENWFKRLPEWHEKLEEKSKKKKMRTMEKGEGETMSSYSKPTKEEKASLFSLKHLMKEMGMEVENVFVPVICKAVCKIFRDRYPLGRMFSRKRQTFFCNDDKELLKNLVQMELLNHQKRKTVKEIPQTTGVEDMSISVSAESRLIPANPNMALTKVKKPATDLHNSNFSQDKIGAVPVDSIAFS